MRLEWNRKAVEDLDRLAEWIAQEDLSQAVEVVKRIQTKVQQLKDFPYSGRTTKHPKIRELIVYPYIVGYTIRKEAYIELLGIVYATQKRRFDSE